MDRHEEVERRRRARRNMDDGRSRSTGAIIAAPTTSLPEEIGGVRNWDYRYTWLRDAALTLDGLMSIGYHDESINFWNWLRRILSKRTRLQIMYRIDGGSELSERVLPRLEGYAGSAPVRVGNAAAWTRLRRCLRASPGSRTTSDCSRKKSSRRPGSSWATFLKRSRIWQ